MNLRTRTRTRTRRLAGITLALLLPLQWHTALAAPPQLGVFYFPGWKDDTIGLAYPKPWAPIKPYPGREPLLGWYDEGQPEVMEQHLAWMASHALRYLVFDYYWAERPIMDHAVRAYQASRGKAQVAYALMWANHDDERPKTRDEFAGMVDDLVRNHLARPEYLRVGGKPVLLVMVPTHLGARAHTLGLTSADMTAALRTAARKAGLPGLLLLAGAGGGTNEVTQNAKRWGYDGYFAYNYHAGPDGRSGGQQRASHSYPELDQGYRQHWAWFMQQADMPYLLPLTSGWDNRPWGGSADPLHDNSLSTVGEFTQHLKAARTVLLANPAKTFNLGLICCWNEFGEGSFIEPTKAQGTQYLGAIQSVFAP